MIITTSGQYQTPSNCGTVRLVIAIGGGGGGSGTSGIPGASCHGGGGGAYAHVYLPTYFTGSNKTFWVSIGLGGGGGTSATSGVGNNGSATWFNPLENVIPNTWTYDRLLAPGGGGGGQYHQGSFQQGVGGGLKQGDSLFGYTTKYGGAGGIGSTVNGGGGGGGAGGPNHTGGRGGNAARLQTDNPYSPGAGGGGGSGGYEASNPYVETNQGESPVTGLSTSTTPLKAGDGGGWWNGRGGIGAYWGTSTSNSISATTGTVGTVDTSPGSPRGGSGGGGGGVYPRPNGAVGGSASMYYTADSPINNFSGGGGGGGGAGGYQGSANGLGAAGGAYGGGGGGGGIAGGPGYSGAVIIIYETTDSKKLWAEAETGTITIGPENYLGAPGVRPSELNYITNPSGSKPFVGTPWAADLNFSTNLTYLRARSKITVSSASFPALGTDSISWDDNQGCH